MHRSASAELELSDDYERDEFLGDSLLGCIVGRYLYDRLPGADEGALTRMRSKMVNGARLAELAQRLGLDRFVRLSAKLENDPTRDQARILEDVFEAFVAAVYLDQRDLAAEQLEALRMFSHFESAITTTAAAAAAAAAAAQPAPQGGLDGHGPAASEAPPLPLPLPPLLLRHATPEGIAFATTERFVVGVFEAFVDFGATLVTETDYKSILTMHSQRHFGGVPTYEEVRVDGPPHGRTFTLSVHHVNGERLGTGSGRSKRAAHQAAAQMALAHLGVPARYDD